MTNLIWQYLRNQWLIFSDSKCNLLRKGSTLMLPKRFIEICPFSTTWKSTNFLYPPSQQERERDNPHKILKIGSLHWVMIPCNEFQRLRLVTELYMQKWLDNLFAQWVYYALIYSLSPQQQKTKHAVERSLTPACCAHKPKAMERGGLFGKSVWGKRACACLNPEDQKRTRSGHSR